MAYPQIRDSEANVSKVANSRQIRLVRRSSSYWRVTFDNPPLNIFGPEMIPELNEIVTALETDENVKVVVFDSAVEGFFLTHYNLLAKLEDTTSLLPGPTGLSPIPDLLARLSRAPVVSIVSIRGRATGVGSELALASDMRFASRETAILSQWEVGAGLVPGGGPMARLPRLTGRGRALEVLLGADDVGGDLAELYGYVNRACRTRSSMLLSTRWRYALLRSTNRPSRKRNTLSTLRASRPTQKLPPNGTRVLLLFSVPLPRRESVN
jgi:enoyl-CoA hydratase/carnithine racemase